MAKPYDKRGVDFGYVLVLVDEGWIRSPMKQTKKDLIRWYNKLWTRPGQYQRDYRKGKIRIVKAETRVVEEWDQQ